MREAQAKLPIKLMYTSNIPMLMFCGVLLVIFFVSQIMQMYFKGSFLNAILGSWQEAQGNQVALKPIGGLAYFLSCPDSLLQIFRLISYSVFCLSLCAEFSRFWVDLSGQAARDVTRRLTNQDVTIDDMREEALKEHLSRFIKPAAIVGGALLGGMCVVSDMMNPMSSGTGIVVAICIVYQYFELIA